MTRRVYEKRDYGSKTAKEASGIYLVTFMLYLCPVLLSGIGYVLWEFYKIESESPAEVVVETIGDSDQDGEIALQKKKIEEYSKEIGDLKSEVERLREKEEKLQAMLEQKPVVEETAVAPAPTPTPEKKKSKPEPVAEKPETKIKETEKEKPEPKTKEAEKEKPEPKKPSKTETRRAGINLALTIQKEGFESLSKDNKTLQLPY